MVKKYSWKFSPKLPGKRKKNRGAFHQEIPHLPGQRRDICRSRPWTLSRSRDLPVPGGPRGPCAKGCLRGCPGCRCGWENIGKTLENIRKLEKHWKNSGDLKQAVPTKTSSPLSATRRTQSSWEVFKFG